MVTCWTTPPPRPSHLRDATIAQHTDIATDVTAEEHLAPTSHDAFVSRSLHLKCPFPQLLSADKNSRHAPLDTVSTTANPCVHRETVKCKAKQNTCISHGKQRRKQSRTECWTLSSDLSTSTWACQGRPLHDRDACFRLENAWLRLPYICSEITPATATRAHREHRPTGPEITYRYLKSEVVSTLSPPLTRRAVPSFSDRVLSHSRAGFNMLAGLEICVR
ncbi:hypothetical protein Bbelb_137930 [Branchiostoma belcheri]|nr:hypothetical protein Bbelb_137930 [Branchiostoma belcheri]